MQEKKSTKTYADLPDTITPYDYAEWRGIGENKAREIFNKKGFPRIKGTGVKKIADKRAVLIFDLRDCLTEAMEKELIRQLWGEVYGE